MKLKRYILLFIAVCLLSGVAFSAGKTTINAKLDSVAILMGKQTNLHYEIVQDKDASGYFFNENPKLLSEKVEIIGEPKSDTLDLGNNRIQINRSLIIQSFDSGIWEIPAAKYVVGKDTAFSNALNLKVVPVFVDSLATIHGFKAVEEAPFNLLDYLPDFIYYYWWVCVIILAIIAVIVYFATRKKVKTLIVHKKKEVPPYEEAMASLTRLKSDKLCQAGQEKEYYTRLTDILRRYIDRRFKINAVEMTSSQIIDTLKRNDETKAVNEQLKQILEVADFVKFANLRPLPDDNEASYNRALRFVEDTKPVELPPVTEEKENDKINLEQGKNQKK